MDDNDEERWKVLSLTHVEYLEGDNVGKFFAIFSLLPLAIVIIFLTTFFFRRDLHTMTFGIGVIVNYVANVALKKYIAEPRPKMRYFLNKKWLYFHNGWRYDMKINIENVPWTSYFSKINIWSTYSQHMLTKEIR